MARWNVVISEDTDRTVRSYLARTGGGKGGLSRFVDRAVRKRSSGRPSKRSRSGTGASPPRRPRPSPTKPWLRPVRIVLDTNVFVSALIAREGPPGRLLREPPGDPSEIGNHE